MNVLSVNIYFLKKNFTFLEMVSDEVFAFLVLVSITRGTILVNELVEIARLMNLETLNVIVARFGKSLTTSMLEEIQVG